MAGSEKKARNLLSPTKGQSRARSNSNVAGMNDRLRDSERKKKTRPVAFRYLIVFVSIFILSALSVPYRHIGEDDEFLVGAHVPRSVEPFSQIAPWFASGLRGTEGLQAVMWRYLPSVGDGGAFVHPSMGNVQKSWRRPRQYEPLLLSDKRAQIVDSDLIITPVIGRRVLIVVPNLHPSAPSGALVRLTATILSSGGAVQVISMENGLLKALLKRKGVPVYRPNDVNIDTIRNAHIVIVITAGDDMVQWVQKQMQSHGSSILRRVIWWLHSVPYNNNDEEVVGVDMSGSALASHNVSGLPASEVFTGAAAVVMTFPDKILRDWRLHIDLNKALFKSGGGGGLPPSPYMVEQGQTTTEEKKKKNGLLSDEADEGRGEERGSKGRTAVDKGRTYTTRAYERGIGEEEGGVVEREGKGLENSKPHTETERSISEDTSSSVRVETGGSREGGPSSNGASSEEESSVGMQTDTEEAGRLEQVDNKVFESDEGGGEDHDVDISMGVQTEAYMDMGALDDLEQSRSRRNTPMDETGVGKGGQVSGVGVEPESETSGLDESEQRTYTSVDERDEGLSPEEEDRRGRRLLGKKERKKEMSGVGEGGKRVGMKVLDKEGMEGRDTGEVRGKGEGKTGVKQGRTEVGQGQHVSVEGKGSFDNADIGMVEGPNEKGKGNRDARETLEGAQGKRKEKDVSVDVGDAGGRGRGPGNLEKDAKEEGEKNKLKDMSANGASKGQGNETNRQEKEKEKNIRINVVSKEQRKQRDEHVQGITLESGMEVTGGKSAEQGTPEVGLRGRSSEKQAYQAYQVERRVDFLKEVAGIEMRRLEEVARSSTRARSAGQGRGGGGGGSVLWRLPAPEKTSAAPSNTFGLHWSQVLARVAPPTGYEWAWHPAEKPLRRSTLNAVTIVIMERMYVVDKLGIRMMDMHTGEWSNDVNESGTMETGSDTSHLMPSGLATLYLSGATDSISSLFIVGGQSQKDACSQPVSSAYAYRTDLGLWLRLPDLPEARFGGALEYYGGKLHYAGGFSQLDSYGVAHASDKHWSLEVDPSVGYVWEEEDGMPAPGGFAVSAVLQSRIHVFGGARLYQCTTSRTTQTTLPHRVIFQYSRQEGWTQAGLMPVRLTHAMHSKVYLPHQSGLLILGGQHSRYGSDILADTILHYHPASSAMGMVGVLPERLRMCGAGMSMSGSKLFVLGGQRSRHPLDPLPGSLSMDVYRTYLPPALYDA